MPKLGRYPRITSNSDSIRAWFGLENYPRKIHSRFLNIAFSVSTVLTLAFILVELVFLGLLIMSFLSSTDFSKYGITEIISILGGIPFLTWLLGITIDSIRRSTARVLTWYIELIRSKSSKRLQKAFSILRHPRGIVTSILKKIYEADVQDLNGELLYRGGYDYPCAVFRPHKIASTSYTDIDNIPGLGISFPNSDESQWYRPEAYLDALNGKLTDNVLRDNRYLTIRELSSNRIQSFEQTDVTASLIDWRFDQGMVNIRMYAGDYVSGIQSCESIQWELPRYMTKGEYICPDHLF